MQANFGPNFGGPQVVLAPLSTQLVESELADLEPETTGFHHLRHHQTDTNMSG
jgi:hypothetical protein